MNPLRSRLVLVSLRVLGLALAALSLFGLTAFLCACVISWLGLPHAGPPLGTTCAAIVWLFVVVFHFRREKLVLPFGDRGYFLRQLQGELADLGYEPASEANGRWIFRPGFLAFLVGGSVRIHLADGCLRLIGPKLCLERIHKRLRLNNHVRNVRPPTHVGRLAVKTMAAD